MQVHSNEQSNHEVSNEQAGAHRANPRLRFLCQPEPEPSPPRQRKSNTAVEGVVAEITQAAAAEPTSKSATEIAAAGVSASAQAGSQNAAASIGKSAGGAAADQRARMRAAAAAALAGTLAAIESGHQAADANAAAVFGTELDDVELAHVATDEPAERRIEDAETELQGEAEGESMMDRLEQFIHFFSSDEPSGRERKAGEEERMMDEQIPSCWGGSVERRRDSTDAVDDDDSVALRPQHDNVTATEVSMSTHTQRMEAESEAHSAALRRMEQREARQVAAAKVKQEAAAAAAATAEQEVVKLQHRLREEAAVVQRGDECFSVALVCAAEHKAETLAALQYEHETAMAAQRECAERRLEEDAALRRQLLAAESQMEHTMRAEQIQQNLHCIGLLCFCGPQSLHDWQVVAAFLLMCRLNTMASARRVNPCTARLPNSPKARVSHGCHSQMCGCTAKKPCARQPNASAWLWRSCN